MKIKDPLAALEALGQANALLTYDIGMLNNGDRLDSLKPRLDEIQQYLSKLNAMLIMDPDRKITFDTMSSDEVAELDCNARELEELTALPATDTQVIITANPQDDRRIATQLANAVAGTYPAEIRADHITVDVSTRLRGLLALIDPYHEGYPYEREEYAEMEREEIEREKYREMEETEEAQ